MADCQMIKERWKSNQTIWWKYFWKALKYKEENADLDWGLEIGLGKIL